MVGSPNSYNQTQSSNGRFVQDNELSLIAENIVLKNPNKKQILVYQNEKR